MDSAELPAALGVALKAIPAFDRFYFNFYGESRQDPFFVLGVGVYPPAELIDGYVCVVPGGTQEQRNLRVSTATSATPVHDLGPLSWQVRSNAPEVRLLLGPNPSGLEFDLVWSPRAPLHVIEQYRHSDADGSSAFDHLFQSGRYDGALTLDGRRFAIDGWSGQRDRSRGHRRARDRLGMHLWIQAQFKDVCVGFLLNEDRQGRIAHFDGALMYPNGTVVPMKAASHDLQFNEHFELVQGHFDMELADGTVRRLRVKSTGRGVLMQGAGYNGWHGVAHGVDHREFDVWPLDETRTPRNLDLGLTDALCEFELDQERGMGISEYALTRSPSYTYRPAARSTPSR